MPGRSVIGDGVNGMLIEEVVYICPVGISDKCKRFDSVKGDFTNHHIDGDASNSVYWNLIRLCKQCHNEIHKQNNPPRLAHKCAITSATPAMTLKLMEKGYLKLWNDNIGSAGHPTFQDYTLTPQGKALIENLIGDR